jgi:hypothetical protein
MPHGFAPSCSLEATLQGNKRYDNEERKKNGYTKKEWKTSEAQHTPG